MSWAKRHQLYEVNSLNEARPRGDSKHPQWGGKKKKGRKEKALIGKTSDLCSLIFALLVKASLKGLIALEQGSLSLPSETPIRRAGNCFQKGELFKRNLDFSSRDLIASFSQAILLPPAAVWLSSSFLQARKQLLLPVLLMKSECSGARRGEIHGIKGRRQQRFSLHAGRITSLWCGSLRSKHAACWKRGGGELGPSTHANPVQSRLSWAQIVLVVADYFVFVLLYTPHGQKTSLHRDLSARSMWAAHFPCTGLAQAQSMPMQQKGCSLMQLSMASQVLLLREMVTELLVSSWGPWPMPAPVPGTDGGSRDATVSYGVLAKLQSPGQWWLLLPWESLQLD